ncbi:hypothetical protein [Mesorhizobium sp. M1272]|uniref:hypothetical protein n=1 Tax=Mesorhizobium sp. M1272 TaxID=2957074 RepID=UPI003336BD2F
MHALDEIPPKLLGRCERSVSEQLPTILNRCRYILRRRKLEIEGKHVDPPDHRERGRLVVRAFA